MVYLLSHPMERPDARALVAALEQRLPGVTIRWEAQIPRGESWERWDAETLAGSAAVVGLLPPDYQARGRFAYRVQQATGRAESGGGCFIPVALADWRADPSGVAEATAAALKAAGIA